MYNIQINAVVQNRNQYHDSKILKKLKKEGKWRFLKARILKYFPIEKNAQERLKRLQPSPKTYCKSSKMPVYGPISVLPRRLPQIIRPITKSVNKDQVVLYLRYNSDSLKIS